MSYGLEVASVWFDELSDPASFTASQTLGAADRALGRKVIDPLDIGCRSCKAQVGQRCTDRRKGKVHERKPHYRRKADARLVQQAARAMLHR